MCQSLNATFAWVGAILVNIGFVALITWGASTLWPLGCVLCGIYTWCLFALAKWLDKAENESGNLVNNNSDNNLSGETSFERVRDHSSQGSGESTRKVSLPVNLLYGLAVVSFGVTCFLLPINLVQDCSSSRNTNPYERDYKWTTNLTDLPSEIRSWASIAYPDNMYGYADFAYVEDTKITLFQGTQPDISAATWKMPSPYLWSVSPDGTPPKRHSEYSSPGNFVPVSSSKICFTSVVNNVSPNYPKICCSNGIDVGVAKPISGAPLYKSGYVGNFIPNDGLLWFKQYEEQSASGILIYSVNPQDMTTELHSYKAKNKRSDDNDSCNAKASIQKQTWAILVMAVLPFTIVSIFMWQSLQIPSMAVTTYAGFTFIFICAYRLFDPQMSGSSIDWWFQLWFAVSGALGLVVGTYFSISKRSEQRCRPPMQWLLVMAGLAFECGLPPLAKLGDDTFGDWILLNLLIFVPLLLLGMAVDNMLLIFLGGVGFLADSARLAALAGDHVSEAAREPVSFLVFSLTGLGAGLLGFKLTKYQPRVQVAAASIVVDRLDFLLHGEDWQPPADDEGRSEEHSMSLLLVESVQDPEDRITDSEQSD